MPKKKVKVIKRAVLTEKDKEFLVQLRYAAGNINDSIIMGEHVDEVSKLVMQLMAVYDLCTTRHILDRPENSCEIFRDKKAEVIKILERDNE